MLDGSKQETPRNSTQDEELGPAAGLYDLAVKTRNLENEIQDMLDRLGLLAKAEAERVFAGFAEAPLDPKGLQRLKSVLRALFGSREAERKLELFFKLQAERNVL